MSSDDVRCHAVDPDAVGSDLVDNWSGSLLDTAADEVDLGDEVVLVISDVRVSGFVDSGCWSVLTDDDFSTRKTSPCEKMNLDTARP